MQTKRSTFLIADTAHFVRGALSRFGLEARSQPVLGHWLLEKILSLLPAKMVVSRIRAENEMIRKRALRRREQSTKKE